MTTPKMVMAYAAVITALGGAAAGVIQSTVARSDNATTLRRLKRETVITRAYLTVVKEKLGIRLELDDNVLRQLLEEADPISWSPFPEARAQELGPTFSTMIGGCRCECPIAMENKPLTPPPQQFPAEQDLEVFRRALKVEAAKVKEAKE